LEAGSLTKRVNFSTKLTKDIYIYIYWDCTERACERNRERLKNEKKRLYGEIEIKKRKKGSGECAES
jgi:hypothetical protein